MLPHASPCCAKRTPKVSSISRAIMAWRQFSNTSSLSGVYAASKRAVGGVGRKEEEGEGAEEGHSENENKEMDNKTGEDRENRK